MNNNEMDDFGDRKAKLEKMGFTLKDDLSIEKDGAVVIFSQQRFFTDICRGNCCFLCGAEPDSKEFNNEHILPNWLLNRHKLHNNKITLPNKSLFKYRSYTIPCCVDCNNILGKNLETPVKKIIEKTPEQFLHEPTIDEQELLKVWMHLIFLKSHLKDKSLRLHQDERKPDVKLSSLFPTESLHHTHAIVRTIITNTKIHWSAESSLFRFIGQEGPWEDFDYADLSASHSLMLRTRDKILMLAIGDCGMVREGVSHFIAPVKSPITPLQIREIFSRIAYSNLYLTPQPSFSTVMDEDLKRLVIVASRRPYFFSLERTDNYPKLLFSMTKDILDACDIENRSEVYRQIVSGQFTWLVDEYGKFNERSMLQKPETTKNR